RPSPMLCATALQSGQTTLPACAAKQVISSPWGAPLLGLPKPVADSHAKDAPRQIPSNFRTSPSSATASGHSLVGILLLQRGGQRRGRDFRGGGLARSTVLFIVAASMG